MCLTLKRKFRSENEAKRFSCKTAKIATEDIKVWKCLEIKNKSNTTGRAPYRGTLYKEGELKKVKAFGFGYYQHDDGKWDVDIDQGLHACTTYQTATWLKSSDRFIVEMIIPKGTKYFKGDDNDIVSLQLLWPKKAIPATKQVVEAAMKAVSKDVRVGIARKS